MQRNMTIQGNPYEFYAEYPDAGDKEPVFLPGGIKVVTFTLVPAGGESSKIQATTDPESMVLSGTATWVDHPDGAVTEAKQGKVEAVSAIRVVVVSGSATLSLRAS